MASSSISDPLVAPATKFFKEVFGADTYNKVKEAFNLSGARKLIEKHKPRTQCDNVLKGKDSKGNDLEYRVGVTPCWICGDVINEAVVCEHVLPVAQASFFWGLYDEYSEHRGKEDYEKMLQLEYGWAHASPCNNMKSNTMFLKREDPRNLGSRVVVDDDALTEFLTALAEDKRKPLRWVNTRKAEIIAERLAPIINVLNESPGLQLLAGLSLYTSPRNYAEDVAAIMFNNGVGLIEKPKKPIRYKFEQIFGDAKGDAVKDIIRTFGDPLDKETSAEFVYITYYAQYELLLRSLSEDKALDTAREHYRLAVLHNLYTRLSGNKSKSNPVKAAYGRDKEAFKAKWKDTRDEDVQSIKKLVEEDKYYATREGKLLGSFATAEGDMDIEEGQGSSDSDSSVNTSQEAAEILADIKPSEEARSGEGSSSSAAKPVVNLPAEDIARNAMGESPSKRRRIEGFVPPPTGKGRKTRRRLTRRKKAKSRKTRR